jgi:hypothetical protein
MAPKGTQISGPWLIKKNDSIQSGSSTIDPINLIRNVAKKHNMGFPGEVIRLKIDIKPNPASVQVFASNRHCVNTYDMKYFAEHIHPYTQTVLDRYISQHDRPLWWSISSYGDAKRIVITKAERWLRRGIRLALEAKGYDRYGKSVTEQVVGGRKIQDIYGTLRITCPDSKVLCQLKFPEVQQLSTKIVDDIEMRYRRDTAGVLLAANRGQMRPFMGANDQVGKKTILKTSSQAGSKARKSKQAAQKAHQTTQRVPPTTMKTNLGKGMPW